MTKKKSELQKLIEASPEEAAGILLDTPSWFPSVEPGTSYSRFEDDTRKGGIEVSFNPHDGDGYVDVVRLEDPEEPHFMPRFRTFFGGGQSLRVRQALMILAFAIRLENEEHPQHRGE